MNKVKSFEDLEIWKKGILFAKQVYLITNDLTDFALKNQIRRSAISIPSNIAEGFDRNTNKEFIQYLYIAKGSTSELLTQIILMKEVGFLEDVEDIKKELRHLSNQIGKLIQYRKKYNK